MSRLRPLLSRGERGRRGASAERQRGAALLTAMIIVTLIATLSASMVWQQWRAVQVEIAERARTQSMWILSGALDWARLILREDGRANARAAGGGVDHLGEPWATPLAEARLSTFLAADRNAVQDGPDAFLAGAITDAQARYNLTNLITPDAKIDPAELETLKQLCESAGTPGDTAGRIANGLQAARAGPGSASVLAPLMPQSPEQLAWLGIDPETVRSLAPYVVFLPTPTRVNVNTASREVLAAVVKGLDLANAERLVQERQRKFFEKVEDVRNHVPVAPEALQRLSVNSNFFQVRGRLRLEDRVLELTSLIERRGNEMLIVRRERTSSREQPGS